MKNAVRSAVPNYTVRIIALCDNSDNSLHILDVMLTIGILVQRIERHRISRVTFKSLKTLNMLFFRLKPSWSLAIRTARLL